MEQPGSIRQIFNIFQYHWLSKFSIKEKVRFALKRMLDIFASAIGLLLLSPFFMLIAYFIKRDSPGPVFFWGSRMGRKCHPFRMLKFRTMYERPSSYQGPPVTAHGDKRITPIGSWLRDTKINELPQLWNVLIGEMSLVGPRPEDVEIAGDWPEDSREEILSVRPGITSPASILYHDEEHKIRATNVVGDYVKNIMPDKMRLDRLYVRNQSFTADLDIIFWTLAIFTPRIAKAKIPEGYFFSGPISRLVNRYVNWFLVDLIISWFVVGIIGFIWRLQMPLNWGLPHLAVFAFLLAFLFSGLNAVTGLNRVLWSRATVNDGMNLILLSSFVTIFLEILNYFQKHYNWFGLPSLPVVFILSICLAAQFGFLIARFRLRIVSSFASRWLTWRKHSAGVGERVLIVGMGDEFNTAVWLLQRVEFRHAFTLVGVVDGNYPAQLGMWVNECLVLGSVEDIPELMAKHDIGILLVAKTDLTPRMKEIISNLCQSCNLRVAFMSQMIELLSKQLTQPVQLPDRILWSKDRIKYLSVYDAITGLPNRFLFNEHLNHSLAYSRRYQTLLMIMFIQLEDLPEDCDTFGQRFRSELLIQVAKRLKGQKRESDTLAYLENNEFGLIIENVTDESVMYLIAIRIQNLFKLTFSIGDQQVAIVPKIQVCSNVQDCIQLGDIEYEGLEMLMSQRKPIFNTNEGL